MSEVSFSTRQIRLLIQHSKLVLDRIRSNSVYKDTTTRTMESKDTPVAAAAAGKVYKAGSRVGRGVPDITSAYTKKCPCSREKTIVFCRACGYYCNGRIRLKCQQHPRVTFLLDISECPRCHSSVFLDEYFRTL